MGSRTARNIYFWVFLFVIKESDVDDQHVYSKAFYYALIIFLMMFFMFLTYFNNFVLLPKLLFKKRWFLYIVSAFSLTFFITFIYIYVLKLLPVFFPGISPPDLSIITNPVSDDRSIWGILNDMELFLSFILIWVFFVSMLGYSNEAVAKMRRMQEMINRHRETELAFLKNQINPHFLFNTLNNLYSLSLKKSDEAPEAILKLSSIMRYILYESNVETISFDKEKEVMQAYIDIELLRVRETPGIQFLIMADKPRQIPPLLWLPILENAFKHGRSTEDLSIDFRFTIRDNKLVIYCENSTTPHSGEKEAGGIGLANLRKRLELLYPEKHTIHINPGQNSFIIEVQITLD
jgi:two-component system LytT family sensor kinase